MSVPSEAAEFRSGYDSGVTELAKWDGLYMGSMINAANYGGSFFGVDKSVFEGEIGYEWSNGFSRGSQFALAAAGGVAAVQFVGATAIANGGTAVLANTYYSVANAALANPTATYVYGGLALNMLGGAIQGYEVDEFTGAIQGAVIVGIFHVAANPSILPSRSTWNQVRPVQPGEFGDDFIDMVQLPNGIWAVPDKSQMLIPASQRVLSIVAGQQSPSFQFPPNWNGLTLQLQPPQSPSLLSLPTTGQIGNPDAGLSSKVAAKGGTQLSVEDKLARYLLNPEHPIGGPKAKWFEQALGFTRSNADDLAKQLTFDPGKAVQTAVTEHGTKFNQIIDVVGANGRKIPIKVAWIRNNDGVVRIVTAVPEN